jgi:hypothetical protein
MQRTTPFLFCLILSAAACGPSTAPDTTSADSAISTVTKSPCSGVYDAKGGSVPRGSLRIYSVQNARLILALHLDANADPPDDEITTVRFAMPVPLTGASAALYTDLTKDEDLNDVPDPAGCRVVLARTPAGDVDVTITHCTAELVGRRVSVGPVHFARRVHAGVADDPYTGAFQETAPGFREFRTGGKSLALTGLLPDAKHVGLSLSLGGVAPISVVGDVTRAGLAANVTDSHGCPGTVELRGDAVELSAASPVRARRRARLVHRRPGVAVVRRPGLAHRRGERAPADRQRWLRLVTTMEMRSPFRRRGHPVPRRPRSEVT